MDDANKQAIALWRLGVLGPLVSARLEHGDRLAYFKQTAARTHQEPGGDLVKLSPRTVECWYYAYNKGGFKALFPASRRDCNTSRAIRKDVEALILRIKREKPRRSMSEDGPAQELGLKQAIFKHGPLPRIYYVDRGPAYTARSLRLICAELGIRLLHTDTGDCEAKGGIERWHRTWREEVGDELPQAPLPLAELNSKHWQRLLDDGGVGVLTAESGVGKTASVRNLCAQLPRPDYQVLYLCDTALSPLRKHLQMQMQMHAALKTRVGMAVSTASATRCLGSFPVVEPGGVLLYMAEDSASVVKARLAGICRHRGLDLSALPIDVITAASVRLDLEGDQRRLAETVRQRAPRMLLLDPFVRLHRIDENHSSDVSAILAYLRALQRGHDLAVVVVHHARKQWSAGRYIAAPRTAFSGIDSVEGMVCMAGRGAPLAERAGAMAPSMKARPSRVVLDEGDTTTTSTAPFPARAAHGIRITGRLRTFRIRRAGAATPIEAESVAPVARAPTAGCGLTVHTVLAVPFTAGPDRCAAPSIAKPIATLGVVRAVALRHILGPSAPLHQTYPRNGQTIVGDRLVECREGALWRRGLHLLGFLHGGNRVRGSLSRILDARSHRSFAVRQTGSRA
jgi:hypothetical protein